MTYKKERLILTKKIRKETGLSIPVSATIAKAIVKYGHSSMIPEYLSQQSGKAAKEAVGAYRFTPKNCGCCYGWGQFVGPRGNYELFDY